MAEQGAARFQPQNKSTNERLSTNTVGLVALSDFRRRKAEVREQQEREAREAAISGTSTPDASLTTPDNAGSDASTALSDGGLKRKADPKAQKKQRKRPAKKLLSFDEEGTGEADRATPGVTLNPDAQAEKAGVVANASVKVVPKVVTKAALRKEATEREALRREFVAVQEAVKATEIAIPFVFYDGTNIPGGVVRMKKGDFVWVFLDKGRKVGAELRVGEQAKARRAWARASVDDLMLVRNTVIIPHHYDFHFFVLNKSTGPGGRRLFNYSAEAPAAAAAAAESDDGSGSKPVANQLSTAESRAEAAKTMADISTLEGATDDPTMTKVVDRRWYARNKHIYPASSWQEFDPEKDYASEIRKDTGGNTYFFSG